MDSDTPDKDLRWLRISAGLLLLLQGLWVATPLFWVIVPGEAGLGPWAESELAYLWRVLWGSWTGLLGWGYMYGWVKDLKTLALASLLHLYVGIGAIAMVAGGSRDFAFLAAIVVPHLPAMGYALRRGVFSE